MKKKLLSLFIILILIVSIAVPVFCGEGGVANPTDDNLSKTNSWYYSIGTWYTRCVYDPAEKQWHPAQQQIYVDHTELDTNGVEDTVIEGHIYSHSATNWQLILSKIRAKGYEQWAQEIEGALNGTAGACYVRWDHVMQVYYKGELSDEFFYNRFSTGIDKNGAYMDSKLIEHGWPHHADCYDHFHRYILIGAEIEDIEPEAIKEALGNTKISHEDTGDGKYKYGHDSVDGYDLTEGIPSGKNLSYNWQADSWYGSTNFYDI